MLSPISYRCKFKAPFVSLTLKRREQRSSDKDRHMFFSVAGSSESEAMGAFYVLGFTLLTWKISRMKNATLANSLEREKIRNCQMA
ncbi:hypothetical protein SADUNF_Sadunf12G0019400 [Salix dunnii]|uniref:Uncharacterized protein n=1 Tax=Salix dunnii TaxID=1413687 RepID=A0A835MVK1_9ROSI|nr:hypothetical protein SADUNF_Sadunf12G0019400 [Salix dunnii]